MHAFHAPLRPVLVRGLLLGLAGCALGLAGCSLNAPSSSAKVPPMTFFVISEPLGDGGNLGGLAAADQHCARLAQSAGADAGVVWRAYLSTQGSLKPGASPMGQDARSRIGTGPWHNAQGRLVAADLDELHGAGAPGLDRQTALDERGRPVPGAVHDILTGSRPDGTAASPLDADATCGNWTRDADLDDEGRPAGAWVGHHDRASALKGAWSQSWNAAHRTRGCSRAKLAELGSGGRFYCFGQPAASAR